MKKEKKEVVCIDDVSYGIEEVKELLQRNEALVTSGEEMGKEITSLKRKIGGFKASNATYAKANGELREKLGKLHHLLKEGDELNEKRIAEIANLNSEIDKLVLHESELVAQASELKKKNKALEADIKQAYGERDQYKANYEHVLSLPWYKRIFLKKPDND